MGEAYRFKCSRCGKEYSASWGIGFAFPNVYADAVKKIVAEEYSSEWKHIFESEKHVAVNADTYVYVCKRCGGWKADKDLSLYVPRDLNELKEKYKLDSIEELSECEWVMEWDLKEEYCIECSTDGLTFSQMRVCHMWEGVGKILHEGVKVAVEQLKAKKIYLEAQEYAIGYYAKEGFEVVSEPFMEDGIPHVKMEKLTI